MKPASNSLPTNGTGPYVSMTLLRGFLSVVPGYVAYYTPVWEEEAGVRQITDFTFRIVNERLGELTGQPVEQLIGTRLSRWFPGVYSNGMFERLRNVVMNNQPDEFEQEYNADGLDSWFVVHMQPLDEGVLTSLLDITSQKRALAEANRQTRQLRTTLDASLNSILLMRAIRDEQGTITDFLMEEANQAVWKSLFRGPEDLVGRTLLSVFPGNIEGGFFDLYARVANTGETDGAMYYYADVNGFTGWFEVSAARAETDLLVLTFNNVTDMKRSQLDSQRQTDKLQVIVDHAQTAISLHKPVYDQQNRIIDFTTEEANRQALADWGDLADALMHQPLLTARPDLKDTDDFARYVRVVETSRAESYELIWRGRIFQKTVARADGGMLISSIDVTSDRQYVRQLEMINRNLNQSNDNLQSFAYVASHDLQEPLRKIQQFSNVIQHRYGEQIGTEGADIIRRLQGAAERMSTLIRDLLALSRLTTHQKPFDHVDLNQLAGEVMDDLETVIKETGADIEIEHLGTIWGDAAQLRQLLQNLLTNALKFTKPGQPPRIRLRCQAASTHELPATLPVAGQFNKLTITDDGIGFDADKHRDRIFGAFQRLHGRDEYAGTGIGLAVVKKVAERHGGDVVVESQPGFGARFHVFFPIQ